MRTSLLRRCLTVLLLAAAAATAASCQRKSEGVVKVLVIGDTPRLIDPERGQLTPGEAVLIENAAQGLVRFDARGQIEPGLAETWNVSDDGLALRVAEFGGGPPLGYTSNSDACPAGQPELAVKVTRT